MFKKFFLLQKPEDESGGGGGTVDRGDTLPETKVDPNLEKQAEEDAARIAAEEEAKKGKTDPEDDKDDKGEKGEKGEKDDKDDKKKDTRIPLSRHEAVLNKEREKRAELERQLAQYQTGAEVANINSEITKLEDKVIELEKEYTKLLAEGKLDEASAKMAEIRKTDRSITETKADMKIQAAEARNVERARYNIALERIEAAYPILNEDHDDFNAETMAEVVELKEAYQLKGFTPTAALQKAVKLLVEPRTTRQEVATTSTPRVTEKDVAAERKADAVKKTADAVKGTPPNLAKGPGADSDKLGGGKLEARAVMNMSQKEFASLNEDTLKSMRGDEL